MIPLESEIRELLDADFKDYLGEIKVEIAQETIEYAKDQQVGFIIETEKKGLIHVMAETPAELPQKAWRAVASAWLADPLADHGKPRISGTNQKNPWTRSDRHMRGKLSEKEEDIRFRLAFGGKK